MKQKYFFLTFVFAILATSSITAQKKISIQGILKDSNGAAASDGMYSIDFKLYNVVTAGTALFDETATVDVVGGIYSHLLGGVDPTGDPLPDNIFGQTLYLGVTVSGAELSPRTELTYSPYTISASGIALNGGSASFDASGNMIVVAPNISVDAAGNITGDLTGDITGNVTGDLTGDITGNTTVGGTLVVDGGASFSGNIVINDTDLDTQIEHIADGHISLNCNGQQTLHLDGNGHTPRVGVHNNNPQFPFHVSDFGFLDLDEANSVGNWFDHSFNDGEGTDDIEEGNNNESIDRVVAMFEGDVMSSGAFSSMLTYSFSDQRIKKNIVSTNAKTDLETLNQIQIKDYQHIDQHKKGVVKKVIAQELKEVYPNAVACTRNVIPNVYENTKNVSHTNGLLTITTAKAHTFEKGDKIDLFTPQEDYQMVEVLKVNDDYTFTIATENAVNEVFVYGKWVEDYHVVDYDAIAMLNVSATQEMYRMILDLQQENAALKANGNNMESRLAKLEAMMNSSDSQENNTRASER